MLKIRQEIIVMHDVVLFNILIFLKYYFFTNAFTTFTIIQQSLSYNFKFEVGTVWNILFSPLSLDVGTQFFVDHTYIRKYVWKEIWRNGLIA